MPHAGERGMHLTTMSSSSSSHAAVHVSSPQGRYSLLHANIHNSRRLLFVQRSTFILSLIHALLALPSMPRFVFVPGRLLLSPTSPLVRLIPGMATPRPDGINGNFASMPKRLVTLAFLFDIASRSWALYEDFHRPFQGSYAPNFHAVLLSFVLQVTLEGWWIWNLGRGVIGSQGRDDLEQGILSDIEKAHAINGPPRESRTSTALNEEKTTAEFLPLYIVGSLCQGSWAVSWIHTNIPLCRLFLTISAVTALYTIFALLNGSKNTGLPRRNRVLHLIAKARAAVGMMLLWKAWGVSTSIPPPSAIRQINNLSFLLIFAMSSGPDPTQGLFLTYVLASLALGPYIPYPLSPSTPADPSSTPLPGSTTGASESSILHAVKGHVTRVVQGHAIVGGNGGWHDTFARSAVIVFVVVMVDWMVARRTRARKAASRCQALSPYAFAASAGTNGHAYRRATESSSEEDSELDADSDEEYGYRSPYCDEEYEEYELGASPISDHRDDRQEQDALSEALLEDYQRQCAVDERAPPRFVLVVDPPPSGA
ncbi:hypothetical protein NMY22_g9425 [Coprinellus aureogranulatus]|nr:hypothetical protein NMY22_g9425 [Coprinellus aureogranulatus]